MGGLRGYRLEEIKQHRSEHDAWAVFHGKVYNLTPYLHYHPGGADILVKSAGRDSSALFNKHHPWVNLEGLAGVRVPPCLVSGEGSQVVQHARTHAFISCTHPSTEAQKLVIGYLIEEEGDSSSSSKSTGEAAKSAPASSCSSTTTTTQQQQKTFSMEPPPAPALPPKRISITEAFGAQEEQEEEEEEEEEEEKKKRK